MSTLHGTLDKCAACPVRDDCQEDWQCFSCKHEDLPVTHETCAECVTDTVCNFTTLDNSPLSDAT